MTSGMRISVPYDRPSRSAGRKSRRITRISGAIHPYSAALYFQSGAVLPEAMTGVDRPATPLSNSSPFVRPGFGSRSLYRILRGGSRQLAERIVRPATIDLESMSRTRSKDQLGALQGLVQLARPYKKRFLAIALLALLGTGADLLQPLIYREAINDVAGMFVDRPGETPAPRLVPSDAGTVDPAKVAPPPPNEAARLARMAKTQLPHRPGYVAPRTRQQALATLLWAVGLLFIISVVGYFLSLAADFESTAVAGCIEANLIHATFGHVLHLPLSFFTRRASGGLAKRIDQADQVAPIVSAFAQQIAPEILRVIGICAIMLTQSWRLTVAALAILPFYLMITRRAARRLESGMAEYYVMWENVSVRIHDALAAIKTVKLSGAEPREASRLQTDAQAAYADYLDRTRLGNKYLFLQSTLSHFSKALVLGYGGYMVMDRRLTPGDVVRSEEH